MRHRMLGSTLAVLAIVALIGCGGGGGASATPPASSGPSTAPSTAPSQAASEAPSDAASAAPSEAASAIPSFAWPSSDKELEALLPDELCGVKTAKFSFGPDMFEAGADPSFVAVLDALGKTTDDVSLAAAGDATGKSKCSAGIFRIKGADPSRFREEFLKAASAEGTTYTETTLSGQDVFTSSDPDAGFRFAYFKGDALIFINADNDEDAASILAVLP